MPTLIASVHRLTPPRVERYHHREQLVVFMVAAGQLCDAKLTLQGYETVVGGGAGRKTSEADIDSTATIR